MNYLKTWAYLSDCGIYRYTLGRDWDHTRRRVCWIMLNPSMADAERDDNTVRRCVSFSNLWGYSGLIVVNLFALRATNPAELYHHDYPVGPDNDSSLEWVLTQSSVELVVAAWGSRGGYLHRDRNVLQLARRLGKEVMCLGNTKEGQPRHPLRLSASTVLERYHRSRGL